MTDGERIASRPGIDAGRFADMERRLAREHALGYRRASAQTPLEAVRMKAAAPHDPRNASDKVMLLDLERVPSLPAGSSTPA